MKGLFLDGLFRWGSRNRILFSALLAAAFLLLARPMPASLFLGAPLVILGEGIRIWSSGHIAKNERLSVTGPYSLSRNPLYVGNFLIGAGFALAAGRWWLILLYLGIFAALYRHTIGNEEECLANLFGAEWESYSRSVPRFLPLLRLPPYRGGGFSWERVRGHREVRNLPVILAAYLLLWGKMVLFRPGGPSA